MKNKTHISIDLETLGTRYDSFILAIGAVKFNIERGELIDVLLINVSDSIVADKYHMDIDVVRWWLDQCEDARLAISIPTRPKPMNTCLNTLSTFIGVGDAQVWGNGATFDITILEHAYSVEPIKTPPWDYRNIRDMRTIVDLASDFGFDKNDIKNKGVAHNALHDAVHQAKVISAAYQYMNDRVEQPFKPGVV